MKTSQLRKIIRESIKGLLIEQTTADCQQIYALNDPQSNMSFGGCCENTGNWVNWDPNEPNDPCKSIRAQAMAINPNFAACCDPNYTGTSDDPCKEELWMAMPITSPGKTTYCDRCKESGGGVATAGNYPVDLVNGAPYYTNNPNGTNYCPCCEDERSTGNKCDPRNGTYYGFNNGEPRADHNDGWGRDCWFCKEDAMPGCTQIVTPMLQGEAFAAYLAGTSSIHGTDTGCNAVEKCGDDNTGGKMVECFCCDGQNAQSMVQQVPAIPGCSALNGGNISGCVLHTNSGGIWDPKMCIKPGGEIPTNPNLQSKMKPNSGDMRRAIREIKRRINNISKK